MNNAFVFLKTTIGLFMLVLTSHPIQVNVKTALDEAVKTEQFLFRTFFETNDVSVSSSKKITAYHVNTNNPVHPAYV